MNENLKRKLQNFLKQEAESLINDKRDIYTKLDEMKDIDNMLKIISNYNELEPTLKKFFNKKYMKDKWEGR